MSEKDLAKELVMSVGRGWFVVAVGIIFGVYGVIGLIAQSKTSGWVWISMGLFVLFGVALYVAFQALKSRDDALSGKLPARTMEPPRTFFEGGEHYHYYGGSPETHDD